MPQTQALAPSAPPHNSFVDWVISRVDHHEDIARISHVLDILTMPIRVRLYLWDRMLSAASPEVRAHYRTGYIFYVGLHDRWRRNSSN